ncbi:DNA-directed RNA polymerase II subunit 1 [Vitis vinifera]|uniref:DNA-directed RNA polymerase subunit n=1 Tax=Vitis vinifera TaxID=29760 RepID=A0A438K6G8_VITVI|nr:DNA-directed RNA polymerase II subunit 1 [Vitis vinifera]
MDMRFPYSPAEFAKVRAVQFGVLSPDEIRQMSVVEIDQSETMERGKPKRGGLADPRLGAMGKTQKCDTCMGSMAECPGHFGHLELAKPMFHTGFMRTVLTVLRCVCFSCSRILSDEVLPTLNFFQGFNYDVWNVGEDPKFKQALLIRNPKKRLPKIWDACKNKTNVKVQPKLSVDGMKIIAEFNAQKKRGDPEQLPEPAERKKQLSAERVLGVLKSRALTQNTQKSISDEDCLLLGLNPKYARPDWMILQVLPIPPPAVRPSVMMTGGSGKSEASGISDDLTYQLAMIIRHNENLRTQERKGAPAHIILEYSHLLQFYIATYFDNDLPGQPRSTQRSGRPIKSICNRLKAKEGRIRGNLMGKRVDFSARTVITPDPNINIDELGELVEYGPYPPPGKTGAKYIIRDNGQRLDLRYLKKAVERHLNDGDYVLFNRQPSLHKMSIMGHRPDQDYAIFNFPAEVLELMMVPKCIVSPQSNRPVMGIVQDTLLGCRKITKRDTFIAKDVFMNILMWWEDFDGKIPAPAILKPRPLWTRKEVFNLIIPKQINLLRYSAWHSECETGFLTPGDTQVRIERGELLSGTLCKKTLGTSTGSLIHVIWEEVGRDAACKFLGHTQWLVIIGFCRMVSVLGLVLNRARDDAGSSAQKSLSESNNLKAMVTAGSKEVSSIYHR